jgi:hypothetical protein
MSAVNYLSSLISVAGLLFVVLWLWRDYCEDRYRARLFMLRERLFDLAADGAGGLSFDAAGYGRLRTTINGQIRFASQVDIIGMVIGALVMNKLSLRLSRDFESEWNQALAALPEKGAIEITELREQMHRETLRHVLLCSPFTTLLILPVVVVVVAVVVLVSAALSGAWRKSLGALRLTAERLRSAADAAAFGEGCLA